MTIKSLKMIKRTAIIKKYRQQKAEKSEIKFSDFCKQRKIEHIQLDKPGSIFKRKKYLVNVDGKCPDFWCRKNKQEIFVEIKTLINITNDARERKINNAIEVGLKRGEKVIQTSEVFNPIPELIGPFENFLRGSSLKFKNINSKYSFPKVLLLNNIINSRFSCNSIFLGAYDSYSKIDGELKYTGMRKKERSLFDKTGSNVSAVIFWNKEEKHFNGIANPRAKIEFSESDFDLFFGDNDYDKKV